MFLTDHLLAFEITSIVLLVAAVGGVVLGIRADARGSGNLMLGPGVTWYLVVAAMLFAIGTLGVMLRRSPLIVLLSLEIMLNGAISRSSASRVCTASSTARYSRSR